MQTHTPPSSIGHARQSSDESCRSLGQLEDPHTACPGRRHRRARPSDSIASKSSSKHQRSSTSNGLSDFITAIPEPPAITKQLSQYVLRAQRKFKPYDKPHGPLPTALELRYVDRFCGKCPGETDMSLADVKAGKDVFERGVALLSKETITQIVVAKRAACESMRLRAMTTAWEIQASSEHSKLLELIFKEEARKFANRAAAVSFMEMLVPQNKQELEASMDFHVGAYSHDLTSLAVGDLQLEQVEGLARNLPEEDGSDVERNPVESESESELDG
ncbi:uncharacterized protein F5891DRAFT_1187190 [Suillus fuscotomentosus]|uniref:Uncharacterized protein n=1 Tax=Suillus fuscotomentosus TaxID=1912939 RepID=A0AAD4EB30_9AGAM|nr:uncharacterized protein F5891DRAFT_1187190 [Suillus fuscotomentosus]KAG1901729.1 hypothetical protein F5891DRAFT_1187190 [Suillus fuscotomentosus]